MVVAVVTTQILTTEGAKMADFDRAISFVLGEASGTGCGGTDAFG